MISNLKLERNSKFPPSFIEESECVALMEPSHKVYTIENYQFKLNPPLPGTHSYLAFLPHGLDYLLHGNRFAAKILDLDFD